MSFSIDALGGSGTKLATGQFEAYGALRVQVYEVTTDEAVGMTVSDLEERFDVRVEQAAHLMPIFGKTPRLRASRLIQR
jgi:hypothetical protein